MWQAIHMAYFMRRGPRRQLALFRRRLGRRPWGTTDRRQEAAREHPGWRSESGSNAFGTIQPAYHQLYAKVIQGTIPKIDGFIGSLRRDVRGDRHIIRRKIACDNADDRWFEES